MRGFVLLRANPYMAKTDANGRFEIKHLPKGEHRFRIWHERVGWLRDVEIGSHRADSRGRVTINIAAERYELPVVRLPPTMFRRLD